MTFQDVLIGGPKYRELASKTRSLNELMSYPFVSLPPETGTRMFYTQYFMNQHLSFHPEIEVAATDQIRLMVRYNLVSVFARMTWQQITLQGERCARSIFWKKSQNARFVW